jgi:hypothetical protein
VKELTPDQPLAFYQVFCGNGHEIYAYLLASRYAGDTDCHRGAFEERIVRRKGTSRNALRCARCGSKPSTWMYTVSEVPSGTTSIKDAVARSLEEVMGNTLAKRPLRDLLKEAH